MSVVQVLNVKLQRGDQSVSWGFNVQGGKEFHSPLVVQKVNPASLADRCSIRPGDYILKIGNIITENLTHNQARDAIVRQGNLLELTLQRGAPPRPDDYTAKLDFPQHQLMTPENLEPRPTLSPQVGVQLGKNRALLTQSYNSPVGLYSSQNIAETLVSTMKNSAIYANDEEKLNMHNFKPEVDCNINISSNSVSSSSLSSFTSASASVSPVSNMSSHTSSSSYNLNDTNSSMFSLASSSSYKSALDLNPRPKPFLPRRVSATVETAPLTQLESTLNISEIKEEEDRNLNESSISQIDGLNLDINNNKNHAETSNQPQFNPYVFRAIPFKAQETQPVKQFAKYNNFNSNNIRKGSLPASMINLSLIDHKTDGPSESDLLKDSLKNELKTRLNLNVRTNKEKSIINGRLLLKKITESMSNELSNSDSNLVFEDKFVKSNQYDSRNSEKINAAVNFTSSRRSSVEIDFNRPIAATAPTEVKPKEANSSVQMTSPLKAQTRLVKNSSSSPMTSKRQVAKLDDPTQPSVTQSRTFKLLQETLDNGLLENEVLVHDSLTNKNHLRRCSLTPNPNLNSNFRIKAKPLEKLPSDDQSNQPNQLILDKQSLMKKYNLNDDDGSEENMREKRKKYIRSLSLANDESVEPSFLKEFLQKKKEAGSSTRNSPFVVKEASLLEESPTNQTNPGLQRAYE